MLRLIQSNRTKLQTWHKYMTKTVYRVETMKQKQLMKSVTFHSRWNFFLVLPPMPVRCYGKIKHYMFKENLILLSIILLSYIR